MDLEGRARMFEQLFFHVSGIGPAFGQAGFFKRQAAEQIPYAIARFDAEAKRTLAVLESVLARRPYAAGDDYTIADIAHFGWLWRREFAGMDFSNSPLYSALVRSHRCETRSCARDREGDGAGACRLTRAGRSATFSGSIRTSRPDSHRCLR